MLIVVALGGNAILRPGEAGTTAEQERNVDLAAEQLADLVARGADLIVTHGNGPQVGNAMLRNEMAAAELPPLPLATCVAQTQGQIGTMIELALRRSFRRRRIDRPVATLVTHVVVDRDDPGFVQPSKPVGRLYPDLQAARLTDRDPDAVWMEVPGTGWRRVVASPAPREILELDTVRSLAGRACVIAAGGGGIPVCREESGALRPVPAVVDKDAASSLLARALRADLFLILTAVPGVALNFGRPDQQFLRELTVPQLRAYQQQGQFGQGSMAPKVQAACEFVASTGRPCVIGSLLEAHAALEGRSGTRIRGAARQSGGIA